MAKKTIIKNMLLFALWCCIGGGTIVLLVAAIQRKDASKCTGVEIEIKGVSNNFFVDKNDILETITSICGGKPVGKTVGSFDLGEMEQILQQNVWVKNVQLFFDNNEVLQVNVLEREPVARVFTSSGNSFYIDSSLSMLPLSEKFSARLPVFTNFPTDKKVLLKADSNLLKGILAVSMALQQDEFNMAMVDQVDITPQRSFEMVPKIGNSIIIFGDADHAPEKLAKLRLFYKQIIMKAGWNKYSEINVQFNSQVVAKRKGTEEVKADSLRTLELIQMIAANAERMASDSMQTIVQDNEHNTTSNTLIQQSIERDYNSSTSSQARAQDEPDTTSNTKPAASPVTVPLTKPADKPLVSPVVKPVVKPAEKTIVKLAAESKKPVVTKPAINIVKPKPAEIKKQPKLVMPKQLPKPVTKPVNEY